MATNPHWTEEEDEELRRLVEEYGPKKWSLIATKLKTKGSKQCRRRWKNYLNAELKQGGWSAEEDRILIEGHKQFGNKWTEIAKLVGGRTDNAVKNRWAALCKRTQKIQRNTVGSRSRRGARAAAEEEDEEDEDTPEPPSIINGMLPSPRASPRLHGHRGAQSMQGFPPLHDQGGHMQMHHMQGMHHHNMHHHVMHHQQNMGMASGLDAAYAGTGSSLKRGASGHNLHDQQQPAPKRRHLDVQVPQPQYHHMQAPNSGGSGGARTPRGRSAAAATSSQYLGMGGGGGAGGLGSSGSGPLSPRSAAALVVSGMPLGSAGSGAAGGGAGPSSAPPTTSPPGGKGKRPDLTLHIPNPAAADPAPMQQQNGSSAVEIRVSKDILSPEEIRFVNELNEMDIPLSIALDDEPPLSTSRRAAQDALTALVAGSPTGMMMGPLSLGGPLTLTGAYPPPSTGPVNVTSTNGQAGFDDLLKWLQTGLTPRSTRGGPTPRGGSSTANGGGSSGQGPSPRPLTRSLTKSLTPRGGAIANGTAPAQQAGMANSRLTTPRGGSASGAGPSSQSQSQSQQGDGQLHDGHRQLLCKLLSTAKASMEQDMMQEAQAAAPPAPAPTAPPAPQTRTRSGLTPRSPGNRAGTGPAYATQHSSQPQQAQYLEMAPPPSQPMLSQRVTRSHGHGSGTVVAVAALPPLPPMPPSSNTVLLAQSSAPSANGHGGGHGHGMLSGRITRQAAAQQQQQQQVVQVQTLQPVQAVQVQHPGPAGALTLHPMSNHATLLSPGPGGLLSVGPLSSSRSGGGLSWRGGDVTPHLSQHEMAMLLDALTGDDFLLPSVH